MKDYGLYVGQLVRVGNRCADKNSYQRVVGKEGTIREIRTHRNISKEPLRFPYCLVSVRAETMNLTWSIQMEDCLPIEQNNRGQSYLLEKE